MKWKIFQPFRINNFSICIFQQGVIMDYLSSPWHLQ